TVNIEGLYYQLLGGRASVVAPPDTVYTGHISIPGKIVYEGTEYTVNVTPNAQFGKVEEITFKPGHSAPAYLYVNNNGGLRPPEKLKRINIESFDDPNVTWTPFQIHLGSCGAAVSADAYHESPDIAVVQIKEFNIYGPDGNRLKPFLWTHDKSERVYPDENGRFVLGPNFTIEGKPSEVMAVSSYTVLYFQVEYEGKVATVRVNADLRESDPVYVDGSDLEFALDNRGLCVVCGFKAGADADGFISIPDSAEFSGIMKPVVAVRDKAFIGANITGVRFGSAMTEVRNQAFANCPGLEKVVFDNSSCMASYRAFAYCPKLSTIEFNGKCLPTFSAKSLDGTPALKTLNLPVNSNFSRAVSEAALSGLFDVEIIENNDEAVRIRFKSGLCDSIGNPIPMCAYNNYKTKGFQDGYEAIVNHVTTFAIEDGIVSIDKADMFNETLSGATVYNSVLSFGYPAQENPYFRGGVTDGDVDAATGLSQFFMLEIPQNGLPDPTDIGGLQYSIGDSEGITVVTTTENVSSVFIPSEVTINGQSYDVTAIGSETFSENTALTEVVIPQTVMSIGSRAFAGTSVGEIDLSGNRDIEFGTDVFADCRSLTSLKLPADQSELPYGFIAGSTALKTLDIPQGCTLLDILGEDKTPFGATGERSYGPLTVDLQRNDGEYVVFKIESGFTCGDTKLPVCAYIESDNKMLVCPSVDGQIVIPAEYLLPETSSQARSRAASVPCTLHFAIADNAYIPSLPNGGQLLTICVSPADAASVAEIEADSSSIEATLYNMQGIPVNSEDCAPGIYLLRRGNKVTKVVINTR
ncbi:MAG: leucine-rich repeat domain-containing protein, partial [Muribaculaceae bacterium]|nr:leucine-rich repeat domain-containing protein [Muribaculaceae bacterium]